MYPGNSTAIVFSDVNGEPWPIVNVTSMESKEVDAQIAGNNGKSNTVLVSLKSNSHSAKSIVVTLADYKTPIVFKINTDVNIVDFRVDLALNLISPDLR